jgi:Uma2 family endonuclease
MTTKPPPAPEGPHRLTREQYHEMGRRGYFDGKRVELVFGEVVEMSPIGWVHRIGTGLVTDALERAFPGAFFVDVQQPFPVSGGKAGSEPQPDVAVYPGRRQDYTDHPASAVLIVEVADTTLAYDLTTKAELYATAGIADYWVLDVENRRLHVFRDPQHNATPEATSYHTHTFLSPNDRVSPLTAPGASILVSELLP